MHAPKHKFAGPNAAALGSACVTQPAFFRGTRHGERPMRNPLRTAGALRCVLPALLCLAGWSGAVAASDAVFHACFEAVCQADADASRFLQQSSFGASSGDIDEVRVRGPGAWIDWQMTLPPTLARPYIDTLSGAYQGNRVDAWFANAGAAPDQLRQRVAFALSEILVISDNSDFLTNDVKGIAEYNDLLVRGAFGSYRDLLEQVTRSPQMGIYLTHRRNRKASATTAPDENYAREVMQLFSIGLVWLNDDGSVKLDAGGQPYPTYDQAVVTDMAKVLTGFANACDPADSGCDPYSSIDYGSEQGARDYAPMVCFPQHHSTEAKTLFPLGPGSSQRKLLAPAPVVCDPKPVSANDVASCYAYCDQDLDDALDALADHPNVAPFVARQLIQRLVTSNPSAQYVQRAAHAFDASGRNLGSLVRAILLDAEARDTAARPADFGKLREPLLRLTALWRAFGAQPGSDCSSGCVQMGLRSPEQSFDQRPLGARSVFNFFAPDYAQPGPIATASLVSPEFQIVNQATLLSSANELFGMVWSGYGHDSLAYARPTSKASLPVGGIDALPHEAGALIDAINLRLMGGAMSGAYDRSVSCQSGLPTGSGMQGVLYKMLACGMPDLDGDPVASHRRRALSAIHVTLMSPEFNVQR
jgi:uncharacterized protein (DUF1800 family)